MKRKGFARKLIIVIFLISIVSSGCNIKTEEIPTENLPPIPYECTKQSNVHTNALYGVYKTSRVSELQLAGATGEFIACLQNSGISGLEAKGIIKKKSKELKAKLENDVEFFYMP